MTLDKHCPAFYWPAPDCPSSAGIYTGRLSHGGQMIYLDDDRGHALWLVSVDEVEPLTETAKDMMLCALDVSWGQP